MHVEPEPLQSVMFVSEQIQKKSSAIKQHTEKMIKLAAYIYNIYIYIYICIFGIYIICAYQCGYLEYSYNLII